VLEESSWMHLPWQQVWARPLAISTSRAEGKVIWLSGLCPRNKFCFS